MGATQIAQTETFAELYRRHRAGVYAAAYRISGRAEDAEDVTQDVFVRLWRRPGSFDAGRGDLGSYLRLMARSRALDLWRTGQAGARARGRLELLAGSAEDSGEARPAEMAELHEERAVVRAALMTLPFEQREALGEESLADPRRSGAEIAERPTSGQQVSNDDRRPSFSEEL